MEIKKFNVKINSKSKAVMSIFYLKITNSITNNKLPESYF